MDRRIYAGGAVGALAIIIGILAVAGPTLFDDISNEGLFSQNQTTITESPIEIELEDISILEVSDRFATLNISFKVNNPNVTPVILQFIAYQLYEGDKRIHVGQMGERIQGMVGGSNYYTILSESSTVISEEITIKNTGNTPELWSNLSNNSVEWKVVGEALFNLSSMTRGGENEIFFEFP